MSVEEISTRLNKLAGGTTQLQKATWLRNHIAKWGVTRAGHQGQITNQQLKSALKMLSLPPEGADAVFEELDEGGKGTLPVEQVCGLLADPAAARAAGGPSSPPARGPANGARLQDGPADRGPRGGAEQTGLDKWRTQNHAVVGRGDALEDLAAKLYQRFGTVRKAWEWCDVHRDGNLTVEELERALRLLNVQNPASGARQVWRVLDKSRDGKIDYAEFRSVLHWEPNDNNPAKEQEARARDAQKMNEAKQFQHTLDGSAVYGRGASNGQRPTPPPTPPKTNGGAMDLRGRGPFGSGAPPRPAKSALASPPPPAAPPTPHESAGPPLQAHGSVADATVDEFRKAVLARGGAHGIHTLARTFKHFDEDGSKTLKVDELEYGLNHYGLHLDKKEIHMLMLALDQKNDPSWVSFDEFLSGVRGGLNDRRKKLVNMAFGVLDKDRSGFVDMQDMKMMYNTKHHPEVKDGTMSEDEALEHMLEQFEDGKRDGKVTKEEFQHYYSNISASIDEDDYFELMIRNAWHIPGGEGWCANTSNVRVLVTFRDGSQKVVMIEQDLGLDTSDSNAVKERLRAQGVRHIATVDVKGAV